MKIQSQLIRHDPANGMIGDCQRTCVAVILGLDAAEVPHFCDDREANRNSPQWWARRQEAWLADRGLAAATFAYRGDMMSLDEVLDVTSRANPETPMILLGRSSIGENHVVVVLAGEIVCDPSGNGIVGPSKEGTWELTTIAVGKDWRP